MVVLRVSEVDVVPKLREVQRILFWVIALVFALRDFHRSHEVLLSIFGISGYKIAI